jgi:uncharacterized protein YecT (DUF1311 family)
MRTIALAGIAAASMIAAHASAQSPAAIEACHNKQSTLEIVDCLETVGKLADKHLNAAYQKALKGIDPAGIPALRASERAWLQYRTQRCAYLTAGGGTIMQVVGADCMVQMTKARADELDGDSQGLAGPG